MLETLFGSKNSERVLIFLLTREEGYAREIARTFNTSPTPIQNQLEKLENGGVLVSKKIGRTRQYRFNPRYPFLTELKSLLQKAVDFYPSEIKDQLILNRRRPRRPGKPM